MYLQNDSTAQGATSTPTDRGLSAAMAAMEQRLRAQEVETARLRVQVEKLQKQNAKTTDQLWKLVNTSGVAVNGLSNVTKSLNLLSDRIRGGGSLPQHAQARERAPQQQPVIPREISVVQSVVYRYGWTKHHTLESAYQKWYGIGTFLDQPRKGGYAGLEKQFKSKWRRRLLPFLQQDFKQLKNAVKAIENYMEAEGKSLDVAIAELDIDYQGFAKKSLARFEQLMKAREILPTKQPRILKATPENY